MLEPRDQEISEFYVVQERGTTDFEAPWMWKGQSGYWKERRNGGKVLLVNSWRLPRRAGGIQAERGREDEAEALKKPTQMRRRQELGQSQSSCSGFVG